MLTEQTKSIIQALDSAEKSLALAKKLLGSESVPVPGIVGEFEGEFMVTKEGRRYQIPPNYASKSRLVVGDTLRMIGSGREAIFKQIKKVERLKTAGVLSKKDGQWAAVTEAGSFFVLPVSVKHFKGEIGDEAEVIIPKDYKRIKPKWAALEQVATTEAQKKPATAENAETCPPTVSPSGEGRREFAETQKKELPKQPKVPMEPETPKSPKTPKTPEVTREEAVTKKKPVITEILKKVEAQKEVFPKRPKAPKQSAITESAEKSEAPKKAKLKGEIKVEEELR